MVYSSNSLKLIQIYNKVYEKFRANHSDIPSSTNTGILYTAISDLIPRKKNKILREFSISENNRIEYDYERSADLVAGIFSKNGAEEIARKVIVGLIKNTTREDEERMKWIIIAACILVGVSACLAYLNGRKETKNSTSKKQNPDPIEPRSSPPVPAVLYLVVPASIASQFSSQQSVNIYEVKELIDTASYFLCKRDSSNNQNPLNLALDKPIDPNSQRDVCVEIEILDGKSIIGKTTRFEIKENLVDGAVYTISSIACLQNLYGLEDFNRV